MMSSGISTSAIQINPLTTHETTTNPHRIVISASQLNPNNPSHLDDDGDIISYIKKCGDGAKKAVVERMDGTRIASFDLPASPTDGITDDEGPILCWASFQRRDGPNASDVDERKMLCVLSNPATLHIFDVLGDVHLDKSEGECIDPLGHTIPLPFRARALFSVDYFGADNNDCHGVLILRAPSDREPVPMEVPFSPEGLSIPGTPRRDRGHCMEDELQLPPDPVRLNFQRDDFEFEEDEVVPSLFSLCHPLDEIKPIARNESNREGGANVHLFTNADERVVFTGAPLLFPRHSSHSKETPRTYAAPICVTYNHAMRRHAIWSLTKAVEPVSLLPLWKTTGRRAEVDDKMKSENMHDNNSINLDEHMATSSSQGDNEEGFPSSFSDIYPDFSMTLIHQKEVAVGQSAISTNVFLATDSDGTGNLILCIFIPHTFHDSSVGSGILRRFVLNVHGRNESNTLCIDSVTSLADISCFFAQKIKSIPMPLAPFSNDKEGCRHNSRFYSEDVNTLASDVLIVRNSTGNNLVSTKLSLLRSADIHIADLELPPNVIGEEWQLLRVINSVESRADLIFTNKREGKNKTVRATISLKMTSSPITETCIRAIESALLSMNRVSLSLMIRSDCFTLSQHVQIDEKANMEDCCWYSLTLVVLRLLLGYDGTATAIQNETNHHPMSAWDELLTSDFHAAFTEGEGELLFGDSMLKALTSPTNRNGLPQISSYMDMLTCTKTGSIDTTRECIFDALHLIHEDSRLLNQSRGSVWSRRIGSLLLHVSERNSPLMNDYEDHYQRLLGTSRCLSNACGSLLNNTYEPKRLSNFIISPCIFSSLDSIVRCQSNNYTTEDDYFDMVGYNDFNNFSLNGTCSTSWLVLRLFKTLFDNNVDADSRLVFAMLEEGIRKSRQLQDKLPMGVSYPLLEAIHRCRLNPPQINDHKANAFYGLVDRNDLALSSKRSLDKPAETIEVSKNSDVDKDGLVFLEEYSSMIFGDNRIREAARLLRSSRALFLRVTRPVELSDHDYERTKQNKLMMLCKRSIALPLGRGMITLGSHNIQSAEQLFIPNIVLAGRVPPTNGTLALDMSGCGSSFRVWPEFHNGVAAGLRLPPAVKTGGRNRIITRTWIKFNKPVTQQPDSGSNNNSGPNLPSYAHGGFLMALGLRGYLSELTTTDLTDYLTQGTITTTVGIFLGMAANKRGSCNPSVSKMLCLHIPSLLPPSFTPMDIASPVQAAAVAGIGLLYQGSAHRLMTEFLIKEISQPVKEQNTADKEGFALVCGIALGMVNLQKGTSTLSGLEDLRIEERLQRYIFGSAEEMNSHRRRNASGSNAESSQSDADKERTIDGYSINRDMTSPGAILALGLMYIKSGNTSIATLLDLPSTHYLLDFVRPDFLALRVISRSLVLWNDVDSTREWIDDQIPHVIKKSIAFMKRKAMQASNLDPGNEDDEDVSDFDPQVVRQANAFIIAGSCFSLGLRYAGSANRVAAGAIFERALYFIDLRDNKDLVHQVQKPDTPTLVTCLCTAAISLAMVMAGTGDIDSFRLFRALRWRSEESTLYGTHQAYGAAIGLLFLGGGKCTLGSSPQDVAILIAAFFPHFPVESADNQYHLQALRHLYALATYDKILESVDVESGEKVCLPIELTSASGEPFMVSTPYLISNETDFSLLRTISDRYYPIEIVTNASNWKQSLPTTLFVKRKPGHLSYLNDPNALQSLSIQTGGESSLKSISLFSNDPVLLSFSEYFCTSSRGSGDVVFERFCNSIAHECMKYETSEMLPYYLNLFLLVESCSEDINVNSVWDLRLLQSYLERKRRSGQVSLNLLNPEFIASCVSKLDSIFLNSTESQSLMSGERWWITDEASSHKGPLLVWCDAPKMYYTDN